MPEYYDASAPPPQEPTSTAEELDLLVQRAADRRLQSRLAHLRETAERIREKDRADDSELPDWLRDALERISGADDAPLLFASLHRRVRDGFLTWDEVYRHPSRADGAMSLIGEALRATQGRRRETLEALREQRDAPS